MAEVSSGAFIRKRRKQMSITLTDLANMVGVSKSYQSLLESDKRSPTEEQIASFSKVLNLPSDLIRVASGKVPYDVEQASPALTPEIVSFARQRIQAHAFDLPEGISESLTKVLEESSTEPASQNSSDYAGELKFGKNTNSYRTHSYHTKVPPEIIIPVIEHYTKPFGVVLDPFCGSGMTGVAALRSGRNAVLSDIAPAAVHIAKNYTTNCCPKALQIAFERLTERILPTIKWLYETTEPNGDQATVEYTTWSDRFACPYCQGQFLYWDAARGDDGTIIGEQFPCPNCKTDVRKRDLDWAGEEPVESNTSSNLKKRRDVHLEMAVKKKASLAAKKRASQGVGDSGFPKDSGRQYFCIQTIFWRKTRCSQWTILD